MTDHAHRIVERHCDVAVIGGSAAGLAAALQLGRKRRAVIVVDAGEPGNAPAAHAHGHLRREGPPPPDLVAAGREEVRSYGGEVLAGRATRVTRLGDGSFRVELAGGHSIVARRVLAAAGLIDELPAIDGLAPYRERDVIHIETDDTGETAVAGLYAAGDVVDPSQEVSKAAADGSRVGAMISNSLAGDGLRATAAPSANEADWDHRYEGDRMWSGNPNGTLVNEVSGLTPGRALDVGAGEGGDAIWLAEQGWHVTATDISQRAVDRVAAEARRRRLRVDCRCTDANAVGAFEAAAFDLVSAQYASIPRTPDGRGAGNLLNAVAPGGTLLVVSHDLERMRAPIDTRVESRAFDPDAYVRVDDVAAALAASPDWDVEVHEMRPRPAGAASAHHVDDLVLRARRRAT